MINRTDREYKLNITASINDVKAPFELRLILNREMFNLRRVNTHLAFQAKLDELREIYKETGNLSLLAMVDSLEFDFKAEIVEGKAPPQKEVSLSHTQYISDRMQALQEVDFVDGVHVDWSQASHGKVYAKVRAAMVLQAVKLTGYNYMRAAEMLGLSIRTVRNVLNENFLTDFCQDQ